MDFYKPTNSAPLMELIQPAADETDVAYNFPDMIDLTNDVPDLIDLTKDVPDLIDLTNDVPDMIDLTKDVPDLVNLEPLVIDRLDERRHKCSATGLCRSRDWHQIARCRQRSHATANRLLQRNELKSQNQWYNLPNAVQTDVLIDSFACRGNMTQ